jgi:hypothetical protein
LGMSDLSSRTFNYNEIYERIKVQKYMTINCYHKYKKRRNTMEFRIMGKECCKNSYSAVNWIKLLIHFVEITRKLPLPERYKPGDPWTGLLWLDPIDVFKLLNFYDNLDEELSEVRSWFLNLLNKNIRTNLEGFWSTESRKVAIQQVDELISQFG